MGATNFDSVSSFGAPVTPSVPSVAIRGWAGGQVLYVGNKTGTTRGDGSSPDYPCPALFGAGGALSKLNGKTNSGDVIYVLPGHAESVSAADMASHTGAASGFSIVGMGTGTMRPTFTWTVAGSTWLLDTANVEIANCRLFLAGAHAAGSALTVAAPITVTGVGCRMVNNEIFWGFDVDQIVGDGIIWNAADGTFAGNTAIALVAAVPSNSFLQLKAADRIKIIGNYIFGPTDGTTRGVVYGDTTASINIDVAGNYMHNILASSSIAFSPLAGSTGVARNNMFGVETGILPITASLLRWTENYCSDTDGQAGALVGTASS